MKLLINLFAYSFIFLFWQCAEKEIKQFDNKHNYQRLENQELMTYQKIINEKRKIEYASIKYFPKSNSVKYEKVKSTSFNAYLIKKNKNHLTIDTSNYFYTDSNFNLILRYNDFLKDSTIAEYSITSTSNRDIIIAVDIENDDLFDVVIQHRNNGLISVDANSEIQEIVDCIEGINPNGQSVFNQLLECINFFSPDGTSNNINFEDFLSEIFNPECPDDQINSAPGPTYNDVYNKIIKNMLNQARRERNSDSPNLELLHLYEDAANLAEKALELNTTLEDVSLDPSTQQEVILDYTSAVLRLQLKLNEIGRVINSSDPIDINFPPLKHPRCQGRENDNERGTLFTNPDFCKSRDYLDCLRKQQDPIYNFTEGQCYLGEGPAGGKIIICNKKEGDEFSPPDINTPTPGLDHSGNWTDPNAPRVNNQIETKYINLIPIGDILVGLCAAGGCPEQPDH